MIRAAHQSVVALTNGMRWESKLSYVEKNLIAGETLLYQTRHHWIVLLGPTLASLLLGVPGLGLLGESIASMAGKSQASGSTGINAGGLGIIGLILLVAAAGTFGEGIAHGNATAKRGTKTPGLSKTGSASAR